MSDRFLFCQVLQQFVTQSGYSVGQLSRSTGIPKATIANWLQGRVRKPRNVTDLLKLANALHLDAAESSHLLEAAGHPTLERLRSGSGDVGTSSLLAPWSPSATDPHNAPFQAIADLPHFIGRERELQELQHALLKPRHSTAYIVHGMGGAGKTTLAARLAYRLRMHFRDGVLWASLRNTDSMSILLAFARALGHDVGEHTGLASRSAVVRDIFSDKCALIVLDDATSSEEVRPLLPPSGPAAVLITTRRRDVGTGWGAQRFRLGAFESADREALELFARILGKEKVQQQVAQFAEMADLLGHLPLAIAVAASRLAYESNWRTNDFLQRLRCEHQRLDELVSGDQSVRLSFNLSFEASSPEQQRLFASLAALGGEDFSIEAAAHVAAFSPSAAADILRKLHNLSLLQEGRPGRYRLHPLLQDFARERLRDEKVFARTVTYYVNFVDAHEADFEALDLEIGNVLEALTMAHERQMLPELVRGANALFPYLATRGLYTVAPLHLPGAVAAARTLEDAPGLMTALRNQGQIARIRGDYGQASAHLCESLALASELQDNAALSTIMSELVLVEHMRADYSRAEVYSRDALALVHSPDEPKSASTILLALGLFKLTEGDCSAAESYLQSGLRLARASANAVETSSLVLALGMTAYKQGNYEWAEDLLSETLALARDIGYGAVHAAALMGLALVAGERGFYEQANSYMEEGLTLSAAVGQPWAIARLLNEWGNVCLRLGKRSAAANAFAKSLAIARETGAQALVGESLYGLARIAVARHDLAEGRRLAQESAELLQRVGHHMAAEVGSWAATL